MGFVAQRFGMDIVGPFFFAGVRVAFAALTIWAACGALESADRRHRRAGAGGAEPAGAGGAEPAGSRGWRDRTVVRGGIVCGCVLFFGQSFQQVGLVYTTASKAGFLTALYIVIVPILGIFLGKHTHWNTWVSVAISVVGLYFLSITTSLTIGRGDLIVLVSSVMWACHILVIDHYVPGLSQRDVLRLVTVQFAVCSLLSIACSPLFDARFVDFDVDLPTFAAALPAMLYAGCISAGVGYTLQAIGQRNVRPATASIIMSLESVFGALGGALFLGERLSPRELLGCALMFGALLLSQMPVRGGAEAQSAQDEKEAPGEKETQEAPGEKEAQAAPCEKEDYRT
jgi:drug/metabolite transporter (DMT)-like permease